MNGAERELWELDLELFQALDGIFDQLARTQCELDSEAVRLLYDHEEDLHI